MNPDNQSESFSIDYLNQIAPKQSKRFKPDQTQWLLIGGGVLVLIIVIVMLVGLFSSSTKPLEQLYVRLSSAEIVVGDSQAHIKDTQLRSANSTLKLNLTNANRDLQPLLDADKIDTTKIKKSLVDKETASEMNDRLEEARLSGIFDRTYAREMAFYLEMTINLINKLYKDANSSLEVYLDNILNSLVPAQEALASYKDA